VDLGVALDVVDLSCVSLMHLRVPEYLTIVTCGDCD
jgi:hypothetical protein